ncbi:MAG: RNA polymerase sigma factor [Acidobacteriota bacterium]
MSRDENEESAGRELEPGFAELCESEGVESVHREALHDFARLWRRRTGGSSAAAWEHVLEDYRDWQSFLQACSGDERAQEEFFQAWLRRAGRYLRARGVTDGEEEDLAQVFCERLLRHRVAERFQWTTSFRAYLYAMLRSLLADHHRRLGRRSAATQDTPLPPPPRQPDEEVAAQEDVQRLMEELRGLGELDRRIFIKFHAEGLKAASIGADLGLGTNAVQQRLSRLRRRLRERLRDEEPTEREGEA